MPPKNVKKFSPPPLSPTAFSIARQFTGPPFSVMLESAELHRHLMEELAKPAAAKLAKAGKTPAKARRQSPKKKRA